MTADATAGSTAWSIALARASSIDTEFKMRTCPCRPSSIDAASARHRRLRNSCIPARVATARIAFATRDGGGRP
jgi:hypothetical protein